MSPSVKRCSSSRSRARRGSSRATKDLDVAALRGPGGTDLRAAWTQDLATALGKGWGSVPASKKALRNDQNAPVKVAFTGSIRPGRVASPDEVPPRYVMIPHHVSLEYLGHSIRSVFLEVGVDELDVLSEQSQERVTSWQIHAIMDAMGHPLSKAVRVISIEQQIAQKIHAFTDPQERRPHDLVDMQLLFHSAGSDLDLGVLANLAERTFEWRGAEGHSWTPSTPRDRASFLVAGYLAAFAETQRAPEFPVADQPGLTQKVAPTLEGAFDWFEELLARIV